MTIRDAAPLDREHDDRDENDRGAARADDPYLELFEHAPCGYLETTPDGIITRVNRTFERWTGHAREALLGTTFVELLTPSGQLFYETRLRHGAEPRRGGARGGALRALRRRQRAAHPRQRGRR